MRRQVSDRLSEDHKGDPAIPFVQVTVLTKKGKTTHQIAPGAVAGAELLSGKDIVDLAAIFEEVQFRPNFLPDHAAAP